jgi:hypothetical protein
MPTVLERTVNEGGNLNDGENRVYRSREHGKMGKWMALNMLKAGFAMRVYDINPTPVGFLIEQGAVAAKSAADTAATVDWLFMSLPDTELVEHVIFGLSKGGLIRVFEKMLGAEFRKKPETN